MKTAYNFWVVIGALVVLSPLGLLLPEYFAAGPAWGEWSAKEMPGLVGYIPKGLDKLSGMWQAPIPDYAFRSWGEGSLFTASIAYILSAAIGILICAGVVFLLVRLLSISRKE
jgi:hypothetical protein